ncbi:hypothetical protein JKP88DRAFT_247481 [Tribonema minus]|uniref:Uncharacterized protein n=1 Tax=Tribonema minus TaxID=303371 RepID=A0A836CCN9_9STRA|nr:hypothetical protein JKP88DRAFT_247481 [Tribonema minus]
MRVAVVAVRKSSSRARGPARRACSPQTRTPARAHRYGYWGDVIGECIQNPGDIVSVVNETNGTRTCFARDTLERHFKAQITQRVATLYNLAGMQVVGPGRGSMS